jgi:two-component system, OmpR family, sensor histidine kinase KdpD
MDPQQPETSPISRTLIGAFAAIVAVTLVTLILFPLREVAPAVSLGAVYLLAVLLVASLWGVWLAILTALASTAAFNFFHLEPTGRFTLAQPEHWVSLAVLFVAAVVTAELAQRARRRTEEAEQRRAEANLSAELARLLLRGDDLDEGLATVGQRVARASGISWASIELGARDAGERQIAFPLREGPRQLATLLVPASTGEATLRRLQERIVPALESLLAAAIERNQLLGNRVEAAALRRTDVLKTALLRAVSHDLRSPLTAIRAAAEPLRNGELDRESRAEMASVVIEEASKLSRLIDNLLDLSRLEAGAAEPNRIPCDIADVIHGAVEELGLPDDAMKLQIANELPAIEADPAQLQRAFVNLFENAHRHSPGHPVMVRASGLHNRVLIRVVDRGPGIPPAQQERVFEPFYRSGTEATGHRGSGLGLAIARGFVEVNHGRVWVESLPGQGTSFVLEFPLPGVSLSDETSDLEPATVQT